MWKYSLLILVITLLIGTNTDVKSETTNNTFLQDSIPVGNEKPIFKTEDGKIIYEIVDVDEQPEFPGGQKALMEYVVKNIRYPAEAQIKKLKGRVILKFVIMDDGKVSDIKVVRSVHKILDDEAILVIKAMPEWTPGKKNGKVVPVFYTFPINFIFEKDIKKKKK
jgi:TonB family protein